MSGQHQPLVVPLRDVYYFGARSDGQHALRLIDSDGKLAKLRLLANEPDRESRNEDLGMCLARVSDADEPDEWQSPQHRRAQPDVICSQRVVASPLVPEETVVSNGVIVRTLPTIGNERQNTDRRIPR